MSTPFIDTLNFYVEEDSFRLKKDFNLVVIPEAYNNRDRLNGETERAEQVIYTGRNSNLLGSKAFHNSEDGTIGYTVKNCRLYVRTNLPRLASGSDNFKGVSKDQFTPLLEKTVNYAQSIGIEFHTKDIKAGRVDLCRNIDLEHDFHNYNQCFKFMKMKYSRKKADFENGFLTGSKSRQIACYDKAEDLKYKYDINLDKQVMRAEFRAMNSKQVRKVFTDNSLECLLDQWKEIEPLYIKEMKESIFSVTQSDIESQEVKELPDYVSVLKQLRTKYKRNAGLIFVSLFGMNNLMNDFTESGLKQIFISADFTRMQVYNIMKQLKSGLTMAVNTKKMTTVGLYNELRTKILEVA